MTLILRPLGRGNWHPVVMRLDGRRAPLPLEVHVGMRVVLGSQVLRVSKVLP